MSITDILQNTEGHNITVSIGLNDLRAWHSELINDKLNQIEQAEVEQSRNDLFSPAEVCSKFQVSRSTLTRWQKKGYLVPLKIGGKAMYRRSQIQSILNQKVK